MPDEKPSSDENDPPKKFRITRKRLGTIRFVDPNGDYGFIEAEDFRDDVFFHHSVWDPGAGGPLSGGPLSRGSRPSSGPPGRNSGRPNSGGPHHGPRHEKKLIAEEMVQRHVEFEIDDEMWESEQKLRAVVVRPTRRPMGRKLSGRDATFNVVTHHPRARRKRPDWRGEE